MQEQNQMAVRPQLRLLAAALCLVMLLVMPVGQTRASSDGTVTDDVILRTNASASSVPLATLPKGSQVVLIVKEGEWYKVKTGPLTGYVMTKYIKGGAGASAVATNATKETVSAASSGVLERGAQGAEVTALQKNLKALGYFEQDVTGNFGEVTESAIRTFQKAQGLAVDGRAGGVTQSKASELALAKSGGVSGALRNGAQGATVKELQQALKDLGYFSEDATGYFGSKTEEAVKAFQAAQKLSADGVAGATTMQMISASSAAKGGGTGSGALRQGDAGNSVKSLQQSLKNLGYYSGSVDGNFGDGTHQSLIAYQGAIGLTADGIAGSGTLEKLSAGVTANVNVPIVTVNVPENVVTTPLAPDPGTTLSGGNTVAPQNNGNVQTVDWWSSGEMLEAFPRSSIAKMYDVWSGKTISIYRYGGHNHIDWEPATTEDTHILNSMTGGIESWSARPVVLIATDGRRYAAATNTKAHGGQHLTDNGFTGQACMHFLNSWTHTGKTINNDMQNQIQVALQSGG